ncbi:MAG TPA: non-homologous end-joining DNA ligase [Verrucomicrobiae bacterium]|nr:non-homologous end-joining DNA ligase [Verrucomicrobiae bacterium]
MPSLTEYARKRDFEKTVEPLAEPGRGTKSRFVIQKHAATRLHYDFRLEMDGVLKSWAAPKGIPFLKGDKRLAVQVEDHPVSYINFEGTIPKGQYGGGTVMVWDRGTFSTDGKNPVQALESGKLHFTLKGKKLKGDWHLVRLRGGNQWLLIKGGDDMKAVSKQSDDTSALSGKSMGQLSKRGAVWESSRAVHAGKQSRAGEQADKLRLARQPPSRSLTVAAQLPAAAFIEPMKARLVAEPPSQGDWIYEIKFDGYRAMAFKDGAGVRLFSRNEKDFGQKFPEILDAVASLQAREAVIDGEIVALDAKGVSSFQLLQTIDIGERPPVYYYAFDLLRVNGEDLRGLPLVERKNRLQRILKNARPVIRYSAPLGNNAEKLLKQVTKLGLEGLIGKQTGSPYEPGKRSGAWIKLKCRREQEFVIGGYTDPKGSRMHFGALLVGFFDRNKLKFSGKVGTGFNTKLLGSLHSRLKTIQRADCPFLNLPEPRGSRYSPGITAGEMKKCHWVEPQLVCQVAFSEWTRDDKLRQPAFLGLREDKDANEVVRERPQSV